MKSKTVWNQMKIWALISLCYLEHTFPIDPSPVYSGLVFNGLKVTRKQDLSHSPLILCRQCIAPSSDHGATNPEWHSPLFEDMTQKKESEEGIRAHHSNSRPRGAVGDDGRVYEPLTSSLKEVSAYILVRLSRSNWTARQWYWFQHSSFKNN